MNELLPHQIAAELTRLDGRTWMYHTEPSTLIPDFISHILECVTTGESVELSLDETSNSGRYAAITLRKTVPSITFVKLTKFKPSRPPAAIARQIMARVIAPNRGAAELPNAAFLDALTTAVLRKLDYEPDLPSEVDTTSLSMHRQREADHVSCRATIQKFPFNLRLRMSVYRDPERGFARVEFELLDENDNVLIANTHRYLLYEED